MSEARSSLARLGLIALAALALAACAARAPAPAGIYKLGQPYQIAGRWYYPEFDPGYDRVGIASWYGVPFHGRATANGELFDRARLSAAHPTLPLPSIVRVTNLANRRQLELRVNDRGPFVGDRLIDLSQAAARELDFEREGTTRVRVEFVSLAAAKGVPPRPGPQHARHEPAAQRASLAAAAGVPPSLGPQHARHEPAPPRVSLAAAAGISPSVGPQRARHEPGPPAAGVLLAAAPATQCGARYIQIGAFAEPERAWRAAAQLQGASIVPVGAALPAPDRLTRVRLGPITDAAAAAATLDRLKRSGWAGAFVVAPDAGVASC